MTDPIDIIRRLALYEVADELIDAAGWNDVGDVDLGGATVRFRSEPDYDAHVNDYDCYGRVSEYRSYRWDHHKPRPDGFDGAAVKIEVDQSGYVWWQPTFDVWGVPADRWYTDLAWRRHEIAKMRDLLQQGFRVYVVELLNGVDAYRRPIVRDYAALGGIDITEPLRGERGYAQEVIAGLLDELRVG